jgi:hypothetical protein
LLSEDDSVADNILEEDLEDTAGLFVDERGDTLDTTSSGETTDGGLADTLDPVVIIVFLLKDVVGATVAAFILKDLDITFCSELQFVTDHVGFKIDVIFQRTFSAVVVASFIK